MFIDFNTDSGIKRFESKVCYLLTILILSCLGQYGLAFFYGFVAMNILVHDERAVDIADAMRFHDAAIVRREGYELAGADLNDWTLTELLESSISDPRLPNNYAVISSYVKLFGLQSSLANRFRSRVIENVEISPDMQMLVEMKGDFDSNKFLMQKNLLESKLRLSEKLEKKYVKMGRYGWGKHELLRFKARALMTNAYIVDTYVAAGLYAHSLYDFELYFADFVHLDCLFFDYTLINNYSNKEARYASLVSARVKRIGGTNDLLKLVNDKLAPKRSDLDRFLAGEKTQDNEGE